MFTQCGWEDCELIQKFYKNNIKIVVSQYIAYLVRPINKNIFVKRTNDINYTGTSYLIN
jgi:hypothetical protein